MCYTTMTALKAFHYVTPQAKYPDPQCISSHAVNGACNRLSCIIRLCVIAEACFACTLPHAFNVGNSRGPGFHVGAQRPSPHPWKISRSGQTFHHCNAKIQRENMKDGVVCDRSMPVVVFYCTSKSTTVLRQHLRNK